MSKWNNLDCRMSIFFTYYFKGVRSKGVCLYIIFFCLAIFLNEFMSCIIHTWFTPKEFFLHKVIVEKSRGGIFLWKIFEIWVGFGLDLGRWLAILKKMGQLWATFESGFFMLSWTFFFFLKYCDVRTKKLHKMRDFFFLKNNYDFFMG